MFFSVHINEENNGVTGVLQAYQCLSKQPKNSTKHNFSADNRIFKFLLILQSKGKKFNKVENSIDTTSNF